MRKRRRSRQICGTKQQSKVRSQRRAGELLGEKEWCCVSGPCTAVSFTTLLLCDVSGWCCGSRASLLDERVSCLFRQHCGFSRDFVSSERGGRGGAPGGRPQSAPAKSICSRSTAAHLSAKRADRVQRERQATTRTAAAAERESTRAVAHDGQTDSSCRQWWLKASQNLPFHSLVLATYGRYLPACLPACLPASTGVALPPAACTMQRTRRKDALLLKSGATTRVGEASEGERVLVSDGV